ncbi:hypothetical protein CBR_g73098, partial [Chara braunii]
MNTGTPRQPPSRHNLAPMRRFFNGSFFPSAAGMTNTNTTTTTTTAESPSSTTSDDDRESIGSVSVGPANGGRSNDGRGGGAAGGGGKGDEVESRAPEDCNCAMVEGVEAAEAMKSGAVDASFDFNRGMLPCSRTMTCSVDIADKENLGGGGIAWVVKDGIKVAEIQELMRLEIAGATEAGGDGGAASPTSPRSPGTPSLRSAKPPQSPPQSKSHARAVAVDTPSSARGRSPGHSFSDA